MWALSLGGPPLPGQATSMQVTPLLWHWDGPALGGGRGGLKAFPFFKEALWQSSEEEHCLSNLILLSVPLSAFPPHQEEGTQMEERSGFHPALNSCKISTRPGPILNVKPRKHRVGSKIWWSADQVGQEPWEMVRTHGQGVRCDLSWSLFSGKLDQLNQDAALVLLLHSSLLLHEWSTSHNCTTGRGHPSNHCCTWAGGLTGSGPLRQSTSSNWNSFSSSTSLTRYLLCWHSSS